MTEHKCFVFSFADVEVREREFSIVKAGELLPVEPKAFRVLLLLLRSPHRLITKDELLDAVWNDCAVSDNSLTRSIALLRRLLGDDTREPRYIATVPTVGYRFLCDVKVVEDGFGGPNAAGLPQPHNGNEENTSELEPLHGTGSLEGSPRRPGDPLAAALVAGETPKRWRGIVPTAATILVFVVAGYLHFHRTPKLTDKDTVVLADFANSTGDPVFEGTLRQGMAVQLEQSPFWSVISEQRMQQTLKLMGRPADARVNLESAREICRRTGSAAVIEGSIASLGTQYVLGLRAENCRTGDILAEEQAQAARKEDVLGALDKTVIRLRRKLGESLSSVQKYATPVEDATTPSLEALNAYSLGRKVFFQRGNAAGLPYLQRAVELDPNFAIAYRALAAIYFNLHQPGRGSENMRQAYELREKISERERFFIESSYYWVGTGELEKAITVDELWRESYPRDYSLYVHLGFFHTRLGKLKKAMEEARESVRLEPNSGINYTNLTFGYLNLNRLDEAEAVVKQAEQRNLENEGLLLARYRLAFLKGDTAQMARVASAAVGKPGIEDTLLDAQADTEAWYGRWKEARQLVRRAMTLAEQDDARETAAGYEALLALGEVESGMGQEARSDAHASVELASNRDVLGRAGLALALAGDTAAAEKYVAELDRTFPLDTLVRRYWLPAIGAAVALQHKDPKRALELLQVTGPFELGDSGYLFPSYLRGKTYLMLRDGDAAAAEFQKSIDYQGRVSNFPWGALARLQLARACALSGNKTKAKFAYQDFLTFWRDADPDIPILKQAKADYAKLQ
jgi:eukaryotic-like serine/threonine-protein kinase